MEERTVNVPNISCGHCVANLKTEVEEVDGVKEVTGDPDTKNVTVRFEAPAAWPSIVDLMVEIGYPPVE